LLERWDPGEFRWFFNFEKVWISCLLNLESGGLGLKKVRKFSHEKPDTKKFREKAV
jgi:hypothetical protein